MAKISNDNAESPMTTANISINNANVAPSADRSAPSISHSVTSAILVSETNPLTDSLANNTSTSTYPSLTCETHYFPDNAKQMTSLCLPPTSFDFPHTSYESDNESITLDDSLITVYNTPREFHHSPENNDNNLSKFIDNKSIELSFLGLHPAAHTKRHVTPTVHTKRYIPHSTNPSGNKKYQLLSICKAPLYGHKKKTRRGKRGGNSTAKNAPKNLARNQETQRNLNLEQNLEINPPDSAVHTISDVLPLINLSNELTPSIELHQMIRKNNTKK